MKLILFDPFQSGFQLDCRTGSVLVFIAEGQAGKGSRVFGGGSGGSCGSQMSGHTTPFPGCPQPCVSYIADVGPRRPKGDWVAYSLSVCV